jgi:hypothetical protein
MFTLIDLCVSSLRRGHANLLCIVPILKDDPRRESAGKMRCRRLASVVGRLGPCPHGARLQFANAAALEPVGAQGAGRYVGGSLAWVGLGLDSCNVVGVLR